MTRAIPLSHLVLSVVPLAVAAGLAGCAALAPVPSGRADFQSFCVSCHGASGQGDGAAGALLDTRPADLTRIAARRGGAFPRAEVMSKIWGYARGSATHPGMPAFGALLEGRTVLYDSGDGIETPTPLRLVQLAEYLETIQTPAQP
ncbi:c-type cytochrome [Phaeovulum vinaykumarii]|uniref:Cytochrome c n=1 Tax=Phaeovulum vinaykumarii TaxID=407234 RepID=A0A1N7L755_9RHOB|nr:cytochrome c [Phaeovulum vinaykumarii]SIS69679.1 Cytochrome c [Phaeovulum vinaykumarii]SOB99371.1 cytochrome c [Phaeovulum vinaykumarii]